MIRNATNKVQANATLTVEQVIEIKQALKKNIYFKNS